MTLPLIAVVALTACDAAKLLAPDVRLPDGSVYVAEFEDGAPFRAGI